MRGRFFAWTPDDTPGHVVPIREHKDWDEFRRIYSPNSANDPLNQVIEIVAAHDVKSVIVERRYIDLDFRSEHSHFYSTTFLRYPSVTHRLHFFSEEIPTDIFGEDSSTADLRKLDERRDSYIGYSVMRPLPNAPVGRTMVVPPPISGGRFCLAEDKVHLWGCELRVRAMPFISQDAQFLRCAHSCLWMMLYHSYLRFGTPRRLPHEIHGAAFGGHVRGRQLPSEGLSVGQVLNALHAMGMSGGPIRLPAARDESASRRVNSLHGIVCRSINSEMPPMIYSNTHTWVMVGYSDDPDRSGGVTLYRHDDARGPYLRVETPYKEEGEQDPYVPWKSAIPPLPAKIYMSGERAETLGRRRAQRLAHSLPRGNSVREALVDDRVTY